jgi:alkylation response protein AidB-like acyl-CoA dehydrogenase
MISSLDDALRAVATIAPVAREHAQKSEDGRRLSPEVVDAIEAAGLWGVLTPKACGGSGLGSLTETFEIIRALAYEDTSAGWGLFICGGGGALVGSRLPEAARDEVFGAGCPPIAGVFNPGGSATATDGGVTITGRWPFASGITYSRWVLANAIALDDSGVPKPGIGGLPEIVSVVVPRTDVEIIDDWHVAGLRGTGSMSFALESYTVPAHRVFSFFGPVTVDEPKYKLPILSLVSSYFMGMSVGLAERALDEVIALLPTRVGPPTFQPASTDPLNQVVVGEARAAVRAAAASSPAICGTYDARAAAGEDLLDLPMDERADLHQHAVWVAQTCQATVNELFRLGGASSIYEPNLLPRVWRDINVLNQHLYLRGANHKIGGEVALGFDVDVPLF